MPLHIDGIRSVLRFEGLAHDAVVQLKFKGFRALAPPLAGLLFDYFSANSMAADVIMPVPLSKTRLRQRGYNQSALLAVELGRLAGLPVDLESLSRRSNTPPQTSMKSAEDRFHNMTEAFDCNTMEERKRVLVIDDVATTGATLDACARSLKDAGALSVWGLTLAREI